MTAVLCAAPFAAAFLLHGGHVAATGTALGLIERAVVAVDDGTGGAAGRPGSGLEGLMDRLAILDARLTADSGPSGTALRTVIPCA